MLSPSLWLILAEYIIALCSQLISLIIFGKIFFQRFFSTHLNAAATVEVSPSVTFYITFQTFTSFFATIYLTYLTLGWRPYIAEYNTYILFYTGAANSFLISILPIAAFSLGLDRCFCVMFPFGYKKDKSMYPIFISICLMIPLSILSIYRTVPAYPKTLLTLCYSFGCLTTPKAIEVYMNTRYFTGGLLFVTSIFLFFALQRKLHLHLGQNKKGRSNKLVLLTLVTTFTLDFLPHLISFVFYTILDINLTPILGPYSTVMSSVESALCAFYYRKVFQRKPIPKGTIFSSSPNTNPQQNVY